MSEFKFRVLKTIVSTDLLRGEVIDPEWFGGDLKGQNKDSPPAMIATALVEHLDKFPGAITDDVFREIVRTASLDTKAFDRDLHVRNLLEIADKILALPALEPEEVPFVRAQLAFNRRWRQADAALHGATAWMEDGSPKGLEQIEQILGDFVAGKTDYTTLLPEPEIDGAFTVQVAPRPDYVREAGAATLRVWNAEAFAKSQPPFERCWGPFLGYKSLMVCSGVRGGGKTYLMIGAAEAHVLDREDYLGYPVTRKTGRVLLFLSDDPGSLTGERLRALQLLVPDRLFIIGPDDWSGDALTALTGMSEAVERIGGVDLIGVDARYIFLPAVANSGNDAALTNQLARILQDVIVDTGAALWLNDHPNRSGGEMSGSMVLQNATVSILDLIPGERNPDGTPSGTAVLHTSKQKALAPSLWAPDLRLRQAPSGLWTVMGKDFDLRTEEERQAFRLKILEAIDEAGEGGFNASAKTAKALGCRKARLREELNLMVRDGLVRFGFGAKPRSGPPPVLWWRQ
jgi:hypothetical protein